MQGVKPDVTRDAATAHCKRLLSRRNCCAFLSQL
jgi:hypothetical protein